MANTAQAKKRVRQAEKSRQHNMAMRSQVRSAYKAVIKAVKDGDADKAQQAYREAQPVLDRMVTKRILKRNTAARRKSTLVNRIKSI